MNLEQKKSSVSELNEQFKNVPAAFLVDFSGCTCQALTGLRRDIKRTGGNLSVVKNSLVRRAIAGTTASGLEPYLLGPTAIVWSGKDPVSPAKLVSDFEKANEKFQVKAGVVDGKVVGKSEITSLASLPSKEVLQANLLSVINAPATRLLQTINAPATELVRWLAAWRDELEKKQ